MHQEREGISRRRRDVGMVLLRSFGSPELYARATVFDPMSAIIEWLLREDTDLTLIGPSTKSHRQHRSPRRQGATFPLLSTLATAVFLLDQ
jgi:hypothetical protein